MLIQCWEKRLGVSLATSLAVTPCTSFWGMILAVSQVNTRTARNLLALWPSRHPPSSTPPSLQDPLNTSWDLRRDCTAILERFLVRFVRRKTVMRRILPRWSRLVEILGAPLCHLVTVLRFEYGG